MTAAVKTKIEELGDSRVRVEVEVPTEAVEQEMRSSASSIGSEMRIPGFRNGKVPPQVVIQQLGRDAVLDETVRRALPAWYEEAIGNAGITTVGEPKLDLGELPPKGTPLEFSFEVGVVPKAKVGEYKGVQVGRREPEVDSGQVQEELERLRESLASLETVERQAANGDFVVMDFAGTVDGEPFEGGEARGYLVELGSGRLVGDFEQQLQGAGAGDSREVAVTFPADYPAEHLAGKDGSFAVEVKEVKEKRLPELDDDFAVEAGGYDSLDELHTEVEGQLRAAQESSVEAEFREAAVDAVAAQSEVDVPHELVHAKAHEMWHRTSRRLAEQGIDPRQFLEITGKTEEEFVLEAEAEAETALRREAVLKAVVEAEGIEVGEEEILDALRQAAGSEGASEKQLKRALKRARAQGGEEALREDIAMRKAVDLILEHATAIPAERAEAREKLWTPEKEQKGPTEELWTPGN